MIDHISIRCSDFKRSLSFYEKALAPLGYQLVMQFSASRGDTPHPEAAGLGVKGKPDFWISGGEIGTPNHVAFATDRAGVDAFHRAALAAGGRDNGAPGPRPYHPNYYGAFVLDPDGHNIEAVCHEPPRKVRAITKAKPKKAAKKKAAKSTTKQRKKRAA